MIDNHFSGQRGQQEESEEAEEFAEIETAITKKEKSLTDSVVNIQVKKIYLILYILIIHLSPLSFPDFFLEVTRKHPNCY